MLAAADAVVPDRALDLSRRRAACASRSPARARGAARARARAVARRARDVDITRVEGRAAAAAVDGDGEHYAAADGVARAPHARHATLLDGDRGAFWARDAEALPRWETAAPLRTLLRWALRSGLHLVHAAAVVGARGAALLAGASGAGKSTTALAAAQAGLGYVGDDYCAVELGDPPRVRTRCTRSASSTAPSCAGCRDPPGRRDAGRQADRRAARAHPLRAARLDRAAARQRVTARRSRRPARPRR